MWLSIVVATLLPSCYYGSTDFPTGAPTSSNPTGAPTNKPTFVPTFKPTNPTSFCIEFVLLDKFGDGWDTAHFYLFDSYNIYRKYAPTCIDNRVYTEYCFDTLNNKDGDYLTAMADGYKPDQPWEIYWQAFDVSSGSIYTGAYQTKMVFTFHKAGSASYISLSSSDFLQPNTVDHCESCIFENKDGASQWWYSPTRTPTIQPTPLAFHPTPLPSISLNPSYTRQPSTSPTILPVTPPTTQSNDGASNKNYIMEPQLSYRNTYNYGNKSPLRNNGHRNLRIFYYDDDIELGMAGHNSSTWFSHDNLGAVYTISNATGDILYYSGTMCAGQKYPPIETTTVTAIRKLSTRNLLDKPSPLITSDPIGHEGDSNDGTGANSGGGSNSEYSKEICEWEDLEPGYYRIRVTGSNYDYKSEVLWSLCGLLGHAQEELLFQISDDENKEYRECNTYYLRNSSEFCGAGGISSVSDYVTLQATIHLGGISIAELSTSQMNIIKTTLAQEFSDISAIVIPQSNIQILSWKSSSNSGHDNSLQQPELQSQTEVVEEEVLQKNRKLTTTTTTTTTTSSFNQITFTARIPSHTITTSKIFNEMKEIHPSSSRRYETNHLKTYLQSTMKNGLFLSHLKSHAFPLNEKDFQNIMTVELLNINIINETNYNSKVSHLLNFIVYGGTLVGLTFSILLIKWYYVSTKKNSYNLVLEDSMHSVVSKE